jgi:hypothetical protein
MTKTLKAKDLQLADTVKLYDGTFGYAVVTKIEDGMVTFFRPYATTADFSCGNTVIPYVGIENFTTMITSNSDFEVCNRKELQ